MTSPFNLEEKHILITGASSGIGRQCAITCSQMGAKLTLIARNENRLKETLSELDNDKHQYIIQDLTELNKIESIITKATKKNGKIDGFIHAAGIETILPLKLHTSNIFTEQMNINSFVGFEFTRLIALKKHLSPKGCSIVFISSIMGILGQSGQVGYCASKGALISGAKALAVELANKGIRVNSVLPGQVEGTSMTNRMLEYFSEESLVQNKKAHLLGWISPVDVANACVYLLSNAGKKVTGTSLIVDGGYSAK